MALQATDLFVVQRQSGGTPLLKATATQLNNYINKTLDDVTTAGNTTDNDITVGQVTLPGGGGNAQALQKQEIESLIAAVSDLYVDVSGDTMTGNLTLGENKITLNASNGSASFAGNVTLPGGGADTQALQKQEITALIAAIPAPDLTPYVEKDGDNMTGNLTFSTNNIIFNASAGSGTFTGALEAESIDGGLY
jgi:hypothetical protein